MAFVGIIPKNAVASQPSSGTRGNWFEILDAYAKFVTSANEMVPASKGKILMYGATTRSKAAPAEIAAALGWKGENRVRDGK